MEPVAEAIFYQEDDSGLFIKAEGHITAAVSVDLRELILGRLSEGPVPLVLGADLSSCDYMDSTFMGLLVGFHKRFKSLTGKSLSILRPTQECIKLLNSLGILNLLTAVTGAEPASPQTWKGVRASRGPSPEILLGAHRNLSELSPENAKQFSTLEGVLEQQIEKKNPS